MAKQLPTSARLDLDVEKKLREYCEKENRSFSNAINTILRIFFKLPAKKI